MWCLLHQKNITACCPVFCNLWFMQEYAEFQYRRRHRQRRRGDMHSLLSNTPDPDDPSESTLGMFLPGPVPFLFLLQKLLVVTTVFILLWIHFKEALDTSLYFPGYNIKAYFCFFVCDLRSVADFIVAASLFKKKGIDLPTNNSSAV